MSENVTVKDKALDREVANTGKNEKPATQQLRALRLSPRADILETKDNFLIHLDMPGVGKDDVHVKFEEGVLTIEGRAHTPAYPEYTPLHRTCDVKEYYRSFQLAEGIDFSKIDANIQAGALTIRLPKAEEARPRQIPVKAS